MKMVTMLMLVSGFIAANAHAEVGKDKSNPKCEQVITAINQALKNNRGPAEPSVEDNGGSGITKPAL